MYIWTSLYKSLGNDNLYFRPAKAEFLRAKVGAVLTGESTQSPLPAYYVSYVGIIYVTYIVGWKGLPYLNLWGLVWLVAPCVIFLVKTLERKFT